MPFCSFHLPLEAKRLPILQKFTQRQMLRQHLDATWHPDRATDTLVGDLDHVLQLHIEDALEAAHIPFDRFRTPMVEWGDVCYDRRVFRPRPDSERPPVWDVSIPVTAHNEPVLLLSQWEQVAPMVRRRFQTSRHSSGSRSRPSETGGRPIGFRFPA